MRGHTQCNNNNDDNGGTYVNTSRLTTGIGSTTKRRGASAALALSLLCAAAAHAAGTPEQKCQAGKNDAAGKYAQCLGKAEKSYVTSGDATKYDNAIVKCEGKLVATWDKLEAAAVAAGTTCPSTGDQLLIQSFLDACELGVAATVATGSPAAAVTCAADLASCAADLANCVAAGPEAKPLRTGQTLCYDEAGAVIACAGSGQDGTALKGATRSFTDNGNGTITDNKTGLMWEKLSNDGTVHDEDKAYTWLTAVTSKIATLNSGGGFAGHTDWRVPNVSELLTLVSYGAVNTATYSAFKTACPASCTVLTCSCTQQADYWSSTTYGYVTWYAWIVYFGGGTTDGANKTGLHYVRAVRAGS